jgi:hypothetical protein
LELSTDRMHGCTPWLARLLWLFSYCRCVTVSRLSSHVVVRTRRLWLWNRMRVVRFEQVSRIIFRAQAIPTLDYRRYLSLGGSDTSDSALFLISLALKDSAEELYLFTIWEQQPDANDPLGPLEGDAAHTAAEIGDEVAGNVVTLLSKYIGVRIAGR